MRPLSDARLVELNTIFLLYKEVTPNCVIFFFFLLILLVVLVVRMMHCTVPSSGSFGGELSVLDRQRAWLRWQGVQGQEEEEVVMVMVQSSGQSFSGDVRVNSTPAYQHFPAGVFPPVAKSDPGLDNGWPDFTGALLSPSVYSGEHGVSPAAESFASISRTTSCPPMVGNAAAPVVFPPEKVPPPARKRKAVEKAAMPTRTMPMEDYKDKQVKGEAQEDQTELAPKQPDQSSMNKHNSSKNIKAAKKEASVGTSKDNSKASEVQQKPDYIHVRARRGQATDSHSLAERVRREKISERMKYLQDLVPGCNKITGKAGMLDEIINYVQSLQRQVEFLSMKLATVNPRLDFNIDDFFAKEMFPASTDPFPQASMLPDITNQAFLHYNPPQPVVSCGGFNVATNPPEISIRPTSSAPVPVPVPVTLPDGFLDTCFDGGQISSSTTWDIDLHTLYNAELHQGRQSAFASQQFQGNIQVNDIKMEM